MSAPCKPIVLFLLMTVFCVTTSAQGTPRREHASGKPAAAKATPRKAAIDQQIEELKQAIAAQNAQIDALKSGLAAKDAQLKHAEDAAARAEAAAEKASAALESNRQSEAQNTSAVTALSSAVTELKGNQVALKTTVAAETEKIKKDLASPATLHYKGITFTPGGFLNGETVWRAHATGGDMPTAFSSLPYEHADNYALSETYFSGRQSRLALLMESKMRWGVVRATLEGDFLGTGTTSNNNQSSSYVFRQRIALAEVETNSHWIFSAGQGWSLAAENKQAINTAAASIALPVQIDPNYVTGLVWTRTGSLRITKILPKAAFAVSLENPQILYAATLAGNTPYAVLGAAGNGGGLFNAAISSCSATTALVSYTNQGSGATSSWTPVYKTVTACTNLANISFNQAPDVLFKAAFDPGRGHYELFGIARFAHETIYPGETTDSTLYGGYYDLNCPKGTSGCSAVAPSLSAAGSYSNSIVMGGVGASARLPLLAKDRVVIGLKGLMGPGVGRYGDSNLADATTNSNGALKPIHNASGLATLEVTPTPRLMFYAYYGGDYAGRADFSRSTATTLSIASSPCFMPTGGTTCTTSPTTAQIAAGGTWGAHYTSTAAAVGYGSRLLNNAACLTTATPGYNGSSTGYYSGSSCGAQTRDTQEITGGYWFDIFKNEHGRLRQGIQYGYAVREGWSGANGIGAKGTENMFFTSFRYFLP